MTTAQQNTIPPSTSTFACAMWDCVGLLPSPSDADRVLAASCTATSFQLTTHDATTTPINDVHDEECPPHLVSDELSSSESYQIDVPNSLDAPDVSTFGVFQFKAGFVRLYQLVTALVVQVTVIASDVVSLKDRVAQAEGAQDRAQASTLAHSLDIETLTRRINELCERVASQEHELARQRAEMETYKKTIQELTTRSEMMKIDDDDDKQIREGTSLDEDLRESLKNLRQSVDCQAARVTAIKADAARKIALLQSELSGVRMELAAVKSVAESANAQSFAQTAKDARRARILASVARRMEEMEMAELIEDLCPLPPVVERSSACFQDQPVASTSSSGQSVTLPANTHIRETTVDSLMIPKQLPLSVSNMKVAQPGANIPSIPMIAMIPSIPKTMPSTSVNGDDKENNPRNSTIPITPDKTPKPSTVSRKKIQPGVGSPSKVSAVSKHRRSMLPGPRKSLLPGLAMMAAAADGGASNEVKTAGRIPRESGTLDQLKTFEIATVTIPRAPLESAFSTLDENEAVLPSSSSLAALDVALQSLQSEDDLDVLTLMQVPDYSTVDLSFSMVVPILIEANTHCERESIHVPHKEKTLTVKPSRRL